MNKIEQLDLITRELKNSEIRLKSVEATVEQIDKEIAALEPRKTELERLLGFHKKAETVPIAQEYKKAKAELSKVKARLILINADQKRARDACKTIEDIIYKFKKDQYDLIKDSGNNVLKPLFGGKRGQK